MSLFSKKEDTRHIKEFDDVLSNMNTLAKEFRSTHFESTEFFEKNFKKEKTASDLEKERVLFERHLEILDKLKFNSDLLVDEAFKIVRNESALTEKDRQELNKIINKKISKTSIKIGEKGK